MEKILSEDKKFFTNKPKTVYHASDGKKTLYATAHVTTTWHLHFVLICSCKNIFMFYCIVPPPKTVSPSYNTTACPFVTAL